VDRAGSMHKNPERSDITVRLLERVRDGDDHALNELFERYVPLLRRWAKGRLPVWARRGVDTHDLVQDAVVHTLRHLNTFDMRGEGALQAYLRQAILNRIRDELRRAARQPADAALNSQVIAGGATPLEEAIGGEMVDRYERALQSLPPSEREAIVARVEFGYSYEQVAEVTARPSAEAARLAVRRALVHLAQVMSRDA
jgi:RNA polymerase sigma factor (sigma-70 family)